MDNKELHRTKKLKEEWKDIPGYEKFYQASTLGRIKSKERHITCLANGGKTYFTYKKEGRILAQRKQNSGYYIVSFSVNNQRKKCTVHRLIARTFLSNPFHYRDVNHKDGNKTNNRVDNLEWVEHSENIKHSYRELGQKRHFKPIRCIETGIVYSSCKEASNETGINTGSINHVVNGLNHTAGGFTWERV